MVTTAGECWGGARQANGAYEFEKCFTTWNMFLWLVTHTVCCVVVVEEECGGHSISYASISVRSTQTSDACIYGNHCEPDTTTTQPPPPPPPPARAGTGTEAGQCQIVFVSAAKLLHIELAVPHSQHQFPQQISQGIRHDIPKEEGAFSASKGTCRLKIVLASSCSDGAACNSSAQRILLV